MSDAKRNAKKRGFEAGRCMDPQSSNPYISTSTFLSNAWLEGWHEGAEEVAREEQDRRDQIEADDPWNVAKTDIYESKVFDEGQTQALQEMLDSLREIVES